MTPSSSTPDTPGSGRTAARRRARAVSLVAECEPMVWLTGAGLALALFMIVVLLALLGFEGTRSLWPRPLLLIERADGTRLMGEVTRHETATTRHDADDTGRRRLLRTGNVELTGEHYTWVPDAAVQREEHPEWALVVERLAWGRFYGLPTAFRRDGEVIAETPEAVWEAFRQAHPGVRRRWAERQRLETVDVGRVNRTLEQARLRVRRAALRDGPAAASTRAAEAALAAAEAATAATFADLQKRIEALNQANAAHEIVLVTADGTERRLALADVVRAYPANRLGWAGRLGVYLARWREFLFDNPREANSEGGVFPAIFGTVVMTLLMSVAVVPFGVLAALYLREYARAGLVVTTVRISINNLAGVPSIVFGVFGLGFFCYLIGASIDQVFFTAQLPNPTFGKGGILWAALTLALLTVPVVIVATEEALAAVPNSMREGSYACGASKWQTIRRIVLPRAMPGIMTGMILALARGAGEVAPLMLVGAVKLAPELPIDGTAPFLHPERSFMHLGFHIYDLGFQSQNSEAAKPMVFTTALLLIAIVFCLNLLAVWLRQRLRRRFAAASI